MNKKNRTQRKQSEEISFSDDDYRFIANTTVVVGIIVAICAFWFFQPGCSPKQEIHNNTKLYESSPPSHTQYRSKSEELKDYWTVNGTRGDFTAGIVGTFFSLGAFIYLYLSFKKQREANALQLDSFNHDKIENRFFELIRLHRDNVRELSLTYSESTIESKDDILQMIVRTKKIQGRQIFHHIRNQYLSIHRELSFLFEKVTSSELYTYEYLKSLESNPTLVTRRVDMLTYAKTDLLYLIVFFGAGTDGRETIRSLTFGKYRETFVDKLLVMASLKPKADSKYFGTWYCLQQMANREELMTAMVEARKRPFEIGKPLWWHTNETYTTFMPNYPNNYEKYYGGHQFRLGHYFRHLFQSVMFINNQPDLEPEEQLDYVRHLRGQLSTAEQIVFFLNSLSQLGRSWELEDKKTGAAVRLEEQVISAYSLIKNIPNNAITDDLTLTAFYPDIDYEGFRR